MAITKEQAQELADKYLLYIGQVALRDNIKVSEGYERSRKVWKIIVAKTTPIIAGMQTESHIFSIDADTGEVGVVMSSIMLKIDEKKDIDDQEKKQLKAKAKELESELAKKPIDKKKVYRLRDWFNNNASFLKDIIKIIISAAISKIS